MRTLWNEAKGLLAAELLFGGFALLVWFIWLNSNSP